MRHVPLGSELALVYFNLLWPWASRESKCTLLEVSGSKASKPPLKAWFVDPETSSLGTLDPLGLFEVALYDRGLSS